eukprot:m.288770 g.288770  ORF g.288770 m.288770 type:complete len:284 (-) comp19966_c0_seq18:779-1630(-)
MNLAYRVQIAHRTNEFTIICMYFCLTCGESHCPALVKYALSRQTTLTKHVDCSSVERPWHGVSECIEGRENWAQALGGWQKQTVKLTWIAFAYQVAREQRTFDAMMALQPWTPTSLTPQLMQFDFGPVNLSVDLSADGCADHAPDDAVPVVGVRMAVAVPLASCARLLWQTLPAPAAATTRDLSSMLRQFSARVARLSRLDAQLKSIDLLHKVTVSSSTAAEGHVDVTVCFLSYQKRTKFTITFSSSTWWDCATTPTHVLEVMQGSFPKATVDDIASKCRTDK